MTPAITPFGRLDDGREVRAITLAGGGLRIRVLTLGAILQDVRLEGVDYPLTLGSSDLAAYQGPMAYFGAVVGPVANRIGGAAASVGGVLRRFEGNGAGGVTLHGGSSGTHAQLWEIAEAEPARALLRLDLPDGLGGFPGNRRIEAEFALDEAATLTLQLRAQTDADTLINLANHSYWNLDGSDSIAGHTLRVAADHYLPVDECTVPTGAIADVSGTPFDLRKGRMLEARAIYDTNLCLTGAARALTDVADLTGRSGLRMTLATTEPGLQVYDMGHTESGAFAGHSGTPYHPFAGLALEAQGWPDAPNQPTFPPVLLRAGGKREQVTQLRFNRT